MQNNGQGSIIIIWPAVPADQWCLSSGVARQNTRLDLKLPSVAEGGR